MSATPTHRKPMDMQQRISQQRIQHIVESYSLAGDKADGRESAAGNQARQFQSYLSELSAHYASGLIELALVETLVKGWLTIPMEKGLPFLERTHKRLNQWQSASRQGEPLTTTLSPAQFFQITGLDAQSTFAALTQPVSLPSQSASSQSNKLE